VSALARGRCSVGNAVLYELLALHTGILCPPPKAHTHTQTNTHACTHAHKYTHAHARTHRQTRTRTAFLSVESFRRFTLDAFTLCGTIAAKLQQRTGGTVAASHAPAAAPLTEPPKPATARAEAGDADLGRPRPGPASLLISSHGPGMGRHPAAYGDSDLNPAGLNPSLMPFHGGALPGPGGMMLGPGHPLFDTRVGGPPPGGLRDIRGVPPGARFDPITPFGARPGPGRNPGRLGFSGEPDPDHLPPPGYGDQFM
jgi:hypothetical protein